MARDRVLPRETGVSSRDLDCVGFYDNPLLEFERIIETHLEIAPRGYRSFLKAPVSIKAIHLESQIREGLQYDGEARATRLVHARRNERWGHR